MNIWIEKDRKITVDEKDTVEEVVEKFETVITSVHACILVDIILYLSYLYGKYEQMDKIDKIDAKTKEMINEFVMFSDLSSLIKTCAENSLCIKEIIAQYKKRLTLELAIPMLFIGLFIVFVIIGFYVVAH